MRLAKKNIFYIKTNLFRLRVAKIFHTNAVGFENFLSIQTFYTSLKEVTITRSPKNSCSQNLGNLFVKYLWRMSYILE